jgi:hypothetical protein
MCCFSGKVRSVSRTSIFARDAGDGQQYLAYRMNLHADQEVAMVLPLPVPAKSPDDAVKFIDLSGYPEFFTALYAAMEFPPSKSAVPETLGPTRSIQPRLEVLKVGSFEASFVPTIADFTRLDERFRLPAGTWEKLPSYRDFGFAVFKLAAGKQELHPMAFRFPRRDATTLFFPTVHIHDGSVQNKAAFDHDLYAQVGKEGAGTWNESPGLAGRHVDIKRAMGLVDGQQHLYHRALNGVLPNQDTLLNVG